MIPGILTYTIGTLAALFPIANPIGAVLIFYSRTGCFESSVGILYTRDRGTINR
jgi:small neutral amino acid transporter SnatA (MarC family)